jgi:hypothetical protein
MGEEGKQREGTNKNSDNSARCHRELKNAGSDKKRRGLSQWSEKEKQQKQNR